MTALLESVGAQPRNPSRGKPLHIARMETGLFTNRNALHDPASWYASKYGGYPDALIDGSNMEISNALTVIRRPGSSQWSSVNVPNPPNWFYDWRTLDQGVKVVVDTPVASYLQTSSTQTQIFTKSANAGQGYYQGVADTLYVGDGVDLQKYILPNGTVWNWGIAATTVAPGLTSIAAASASSVWTASTIYATIGALVDSNGNVEQMVSVNATGTNTTQFGTTGNGQPAWNQTPGGTTVDNAHNWTNFGPIVLRTPSTTYNNASVGGTLVNPCIVFDPVTKCCFINAAPGNAQGTTSANGSFTFGGGIGWNGWDGTVKWFNLGSLKTPPAWTPSHSYPTLGSVSNDDSVSGISEPVSLANGLPSNQTVFWQVNNTGGTFTSGASGTNPQWSLVTGAKTQPDGDLIWLNLGSATYQSSHAYIAWTANGTVFSIIKDPNSNLQVCVISGTTNPAGLAPGSTFALTAASNASAGQTTYTGTFSPALLATYPVTITGFVNGGNNGTFQIVSCNSTTLVVTNPNGVAESHAGTAAFNPWQTGYAGQTKDGTTTWSCVGPSLSWAASTKWYLPPSGFFPPFGSVSYGGASIVDPNGNSEFVTTSGKSGTTIPAFPASGVVGTVTNDNAGGGTAVWISTGTAPTQSLTWTKQYQYAVSYEARTATDPFNTTAPPGWPSALGPPTGSQSGGISTASPVVLTTGTTGNPGAVNVLTGLGSLDPQVDTIVIWRTADGGSTLFFLSEIPNPPAIGGVAQPWQFRDANADSVLNEFESAPINHQNDPPPAGFLPMAYHFERIWGAVGNFVFASGGPDVLTGNPNEAFDPLDFFEFPSPVTKIVPTATGILVFLTSDVYGILGGPIFDTFFTTPMVPGVGLLHFNALDVHGGVMYMYTADNQFINMDPSSGANRMGGPIADKLAQFNASKVFVTVHESGNDNAIFISDGSTGWYRLNPSQFPNGTQVWSPFASITGGAGAVLSIEVTTGVHRLLIGGTGNNQPILQRDFSTYQDNGVSYPCFFTMGSINVANPGQIAGLTFVNLRATRIGTTPTVGFLLNEITGTFTTFPQAQAYPWQIYGATKQPTSLYSNAYYFRAAGVPSLAEHLQVKVSFPAENFANEVLSMTIFGVVEQPPEE